ncbi:MAG: hydroxyphenylacetyl-CoA thioesterase PaaI [Burkholderiales bacterium]|nr:hydroxyphenylacetyl-CoA thioesterase PaaI [Burkholderiales bacterium]
MTDNLFNDPQKLAAACAEAMYANDAATRGLGMEIVAVAPGEATLRMRVRKDMLNGHQTCHGGFLFALADSAFAFACNSRNHATVAAGCSIEYLAPGREGDLITAIAREQVLSGRTGIYDVELRNQDGHQIAMFRGKSHKIKGEIIPAPEASAHAE